MVTSSSEDDAAAESEEILRFRAPPELALALDIANPLGREEAEVAEVGEAEEEEEELVAAAEEEAEDDEGSGAAELGSELAEGSASACAPNPSDPLQMAHTSSFSGILPVAEIVNSVCTSFFHFSIQA